MKRIPLCGELSAIVDDVDYSALNKFKWTVKRRTTKHRVYEYASALIDGKLVLMHRLIKGPDRAHVVDHINGNTLDNRRENLRVCLQKQNLRNRNGMRGKRFKGVSKYANAARQKPWKAAIRCDGVRYSLGTFSDEVSAARAYDEAAIKLHGAFAKLNFPIGVGDRNV